jgi:hypothetical protein
MLIDRMVRANVDPDRLALLTGEGADYEQLGFPTQGLAKKLSEYGILKSTGRRHKRILIDNKIDFRLRTIWVPGCHFDRWLADYILNRTRYRIQSGLTLEISPDLQVRFEAFQKNRKKSGYKGFSMKETTPDLMKEIQALL